mgnify:CR=1 FL=1
MAQHCYPRGKMPVGLAGMIMFNFRHSGVNVAQRDSKDARNTYMRQWNARHRQHVRDKKNKAYSKEPEFFSLRVALNKHGITLDQYHAMNESQDFLCAICREEKQLAIDHDHKTGNVRGLLCLHCNSGLGHFSDNAQHCLTAAFYLGT